MFLTTLTITVCTGESSYDSVDQFGKKNVYHAGHRAICLLVLIELHVVSMPGTVHPAAQCDSSQSRGHPPL